MERSPSETLASRLGWYGAWLVAAPFAVFGTWYATQIGLGYDSHAYWSAVQDMDHLYSATALSRDAYLYSPLFAQAIWPLGRLPWAVFGVVWATRAGGSLRLAAATASGSMVRPRAHRNRARDPHRQHLRPDGLGIGAGGWARGAVGLPRADQGDARLGRRCVARSSRRWRALVSGVVVGAVLVGVLVPCGADGLAGLGAPPDPRLGRCRRTSRACHG